MISIRKPEEEIKELRRQLLLMSSNGGGADKPIPYDYKAHLDLLERARLYDYLLGLQRLCFPEQDNKEFCNYDKLFIRIDALMATADMAQVYALENVNRGRA